MKVNLLQYLVYYLFVINLIAAIVFIGDKRKAIKGKYRTKESRLHLIELIGGVFIILPMLYLIRHKNRKFTYLSWTYLIFLAWTVLLIFLSN